MKQTLIIIWTLAGLLSLTACGLLLKNAAYNKGFNDGLQYCRLLPEICNDSEFIGERFGA